METLVEVESLCAGYERPVVGPVSFAVHAEEVVCLSAPNGAGKTTVVRALAGQATVFAGAVRRRPGLRLAWQAQQLLADDELPVSGRDLMRCLGLGDGALPPEVAAWRDRRLDRLSAGQRQQLLVFAALAGDADLVVLDEPTNNMDADAVARLAAALRAPHRGRGILVVSHDRPFIAAAGAREVAWPA